MTYIQPSLLILKYMFFIFINLILTGKYRIMKIKSLTIYCSHSDNLDQEFYNLAEEIGYFLGKNNISLIYGGGNSGLMGKVSNIALKNGSTVIGIIPEFLKKDENINYNISKIIVVQSMSERKKILFDKGDAFLILPGGSGTIEEATEVISWKFLGIHAKPIIIFNFDNYWNSMIEMYNNAKKCKFGDKNLQSVYKIIKTFEEFSLLFK